jgi:SAM-dependent methyltransferase
LKCPACEGNMNALGKFPFRDFDHSIFNFIGTLAACNDCGFVRVLSNLSDNNISRHYATNCLYSELSGVGVGGDSKEDNVRYEYYAEIVKQYLIHNEAKSLVDVGCSRGGFVKYLKRLYPELNVCGVDLDEKSLKQLSNDNIRYHIGDAKNLPFKTASQEVLCYFHVLEHIVDFQAALNEAARALKPGGMALFEVPDAMSYSLPNARVGTLFWLTLQEHINHFTPLALIHACAKHGLNVVEIRQELMPMRSEKHYPSLIIVAKKGGGSVLSGHVFDARAIPDYIDDEMKRFENILASFCPFADSYERISFWGIGLEFFNLFAHYDGKLSGRKISLLDSNPGKQGHAVNGVRVISPQGAAIDGGLACCSYFSTEAIAKDALRLGWKRQDIFTFS